MQMITAALVGPGGARYPLGDGVTRLGRAAENDIVLSGSDAIVVSGRHFEIEQTDGRFILRDNGSTNGTYVNGERVTESELLPGHIIRLGAQGPEFTFALGEEQSSEAANLDQTVVIPNGTQAGIDPVAKAVAQARMMRGSGAANQTLTIMRVAIDRAIRKSRRRWKAAVLTLAVLLVVMGTVGGYRIYALQTARASINQQIQRLEARLAQTAAESEEARGLADELDRYDREGLALEQSLLLRLSSRPEDRLLLRELRSLMAEFGSEIYRLPPEFVKQVEHYIEQYQTDDRPHMERALRQERKEVATIQRVLTQEKLPPDLAYMVLVESALDRDGKSSQGAAGLWQLTPNTARAYGLRVDGAVDERLSTVKATRAACKYIRELIIEFGSGSSVLLALAAYNVGTSKVKNAIRKVNDPIRQRNFWHLYRIRALPQETREFVPKISAAMVIGRAPEKWGFRVN